ncbi:hypothetical protein KCP73_01600 [Salmonella enterica subsp. enterica]|nr:hypothetical protein KCP73_01600 [Salmonella enterica subsp. enterica]
MREKQQAGSMTGRGSPGDGAVHPRLAAVKRKKIGEGDQKPYYSGRCSQQTRFVQVTITLLTEPMPQYQRGR